MGCFKDNHFNVITWTRVGFAFNGQFQDGTFDRCEDCGYVLQSEPTQRELLLHAQPAEPSAEPAHTFFGLFDRFEQLRMSL